jgi:hypothetical protein
MRFNMEEAIQFSENLIKGEPIKSAEELFDLQ